MNDHTRRQALAALALLVAVGAAGCGKDVQGTSNVAPAAAGMTSATTPAGTGRTIIVEAYSDGNGNYFKPSEIQAHRGDVVRFTLKSGVHNIHFLADSNPGNSGLPPASDMLQLPDQTYDLTVSLTKGRYFFQCDPHVLLGMKGHLTVED